MVRYHWAVSYSKTARRVQEAAPYTAAVCFCGFGIREPSPRGRGTALAVDEGNLYHSFYGMRCQFYVLQICGVSRVVEGADPYKVAV